MRRIAPTALVLISLFAGARQADAQIIGFRLGAAYSTLDVDDDATRRGATGLAGGAYIRFGLSDRLGLQVELLSMPKGADVRAEDPADHVDIRISYLEVPMLLHIPIGATETFAPYVIGGPTIGFETRCRVTGTDGVTQDCDDAGLELNSPDFGLAAGGGLGFLLGPGILLLEGRYTWGLTNINAAAAAPAIRNRTATFMAGFVVPLGRRY